MSAPEQFQGWAAMGPDAVKGNFQQWKYTPKTWEETDVDIKIMYCGICASDIHTASGGWHQPEYPIVVGHEIVGEAVRVGKEVSHVKVGDIVGVGAQSGSCLNCERCKADLEPYCDNGMVGTYDGKYPSGDRSQGGYSDYNRAPGHFVVKIPDNMDPAIAAPMLCGGVTVYSPLKTHGAGTEGVKNVGVVGLGGLGHFAVMFADHMGADVTVVSHSHSKEADARKMGAKHFIATHGDGDVFKANKRTLDLIICTTNDSRMPLSGYLQLLKPGGKLVFVGIPDEGLPEVPAFIYIANKVSIAGSLIGSPAEIREMLELANKTNIKGWVKRWDMKDINKAVPDMEAGNARYRYVLVNTEAGGKLE